MSLLCCRFQDAKGALIDLEQWYKELAVHEELVNKTHNISSGHYSFTGLAQQLASLVERLKLHRDEL
jgi:hypothetical protein